MPKQWNLRQHEKWFLQVSYCVELHNMFVLDVFIVLMMCDLFHFTFRCKCVKGYKGSLCQTRIDYCKARPCQNGGQCTLGRPGVAPSFRCTCRSGFDVSQVITGFFDGYAY